MSRSTACASILCLAFCSLPAMAGPVTLLSKADPARPSGTAGGASEVTAISADGRYIVFLSNADNLLPGVTDTNIGKDVFLQDRLSGTTALVSHAAVDAATAGNRGASSAVLSADGRWVAFLSESTDLVAGQVDEAPGTAPDVFLWDRDTGGTTLISHQAGLPTTAAGDCWGPLAISADGGRIAFLSNALTLVAGQNDGASTSDLFLYSRADGTNRLVSHTSGSATTAAGGVFETALSADGSWLAFTSYGAGLVAGQIDIIENGLDVFLYEAATGTNVLVSHAAGAAATTGNRTSVMPRISADGSRVAFESFAYDLVAGATDGNDTYDIFLYDRATGVNTLVSHASSSATTSGNDISLHPLLSADGRYVVFLSPATDLVPGVFTSPFYEVFVYDRITGVNLLVSRNAMTPPDGYPQAPQISADGAWIAFLSNAPHLVPGQTDAPQTSDAFLWSRASGSISLVTRTPASVTTAAGGDTLDLRISADGSRIALASTSTNLVAGLADHNRLADVFLYERATGAHSLVSSRGGAASASAGGEFLSSAGTVMSNDGRYVAFNSLASSFSGVTSFYTPGNDVFLADRATGAVTLVSHASGSPSTAGNAPSQGGVVSADGTVILFASSASNLLSPPVSDALGELYLYDRTTGGITLVSHAAGFPSVPASGPAGVSHYAVSTDGRWVAFTHSGTDLVAGQVEGNGASDVFLFDRATGESTLISHASSSPVQTGNNLSSQPSISADGRYIAFVSGASDLIPALDDTPNVFLHDRIAGTTTRVGPSDGTAVALSADGRWVLFSSYSSHVVPGQVDNNDFSDVFLWDRVSGSTLLVSRTPTSPVTTGNSWSYLGQDDAASAPNLSADGRWATFFSLASDLVSGQTGEPGSVFLFDRIAGTVTLLSRSAASPTVSRFGFYPGISADGRFVTFTSPRQDLVPGQSTSGDNCFLYDRIADTTALVTHIPSSEATGGLPEIAALAPARISADGAWVAFSSKQVDLVAYDHDSVEDAFLHGRAFGRDFFTLPPCRILDTRQAGQGPALTSGLKRTVMAHGTCSIPETARALAVNVTVTQPTAMGYLTLHAGDGAAEATTTINFGPGQTRSNNAVLPLSYDGRGLLSITPLVQGNGTVHLIVDVSGWFE